MVETRREEPVNNKVSGKRFRDVGNEVYLERTDVAAREVVAGGNDNPGVESEGVETNKEVEHEIIVLKHVEDELEDSRHDAVRPRLEMLNPLFESDDSDDEIDDDEKPEASATVQEIDRTSKVMHPEESGNVTAGAGGHGDEVVAAGPQAGGGVAKIEKDMEEGDQGRIEEDHDDDVKLCGAYLAYPYKVARQGVKKMMIGRYTSANAVGVKGANRF